MDAVTFAELDRSNVRLPLEADPHCRDHLVDSDDDAGGITCCGTPFRWGDVEEDTFVRDESNICPSCKALAKFGES
jgi:hypothetical protein